MQNNILEWQEVTEYASKIYILEELEIDGIKAELIEDYETGDIYQETPFNVGSLASLETIDSGEIKSSFYTHRWLRDDPAGMIREMRRNGGYTIIPIKFEDYGYRMKVRECEPEEANAILYASYEDIREAFKEVSKKTRQETREDLRSWLQWLQYDCNREVYAFCVYDFEGKVYDSCCGYYGDLEYAKQEAEGIVNSILQKACTACQGNGVQGLSLCTECAGSKLINAKQTL